MDNPNITNGFTLPLRLKPLAGFAHSPVEISIDVSEWLDRRSEAVQVFGPESLGSDNVCDADLLLSYTNPRRSAVSTRLLLIRKISK